jgi:hypothetical protein
MERDIANTLGVGIPLVIIGIITLWHAFKLIGADPGEGFKKLILKTYRSFGIVNIVMGILFIIAAFVKKGQ